MLTSTLLTLTAALLSISAVQGAPSFEARETYLKCGSPLVTSNLTQVGPSGAPRAAAFQSARDSQGRRQLSTSVNGAAAPGTSLFEFIPCTSSVMLSGPSRTSDGHIVQYGQLRSHKIGNCITASSLRTSTPSTLFSLDCQTVDNSGLGDQWFRASYLPSGTQVDIDFVGNGQTASVKTVVDTNYKFVNVAGNDNSRLVDLVYTSTYQGYRLQMQRMM
ncbi:hypothetical protein CF319_g7314 [Tilletia indica]|nr:hypothetical protein CF319_g7314 [Tilletia indica]